MTSKPVLLVLFMIRNIACYILKQIAVSRKLHCKWIKWWYNRELYSIDNHEEWNMMIPAHFFHTKSHYLHLILVHKAHMPSVISLLNKQVCSPHTFANSLGDFISICFPFAFLLQIRSLIVTFLPLFLAGSS